MFSYFALGLHYAVLNVRVCYNIIKASMAILLLDKLLCNDYVNIYAAYSVNKYLR